MSDSPIDISFGDPPETNDSPVDNEPDLAHDYLKGVAEQDRAIVQKYMPEWNKAVTQHLQKKAERFKSYTDLGAPDEVSRAVAFVKAMQDHPADTYAAFRSKLMGVYGDQFTQFEKELIGEALQQMSDEQEYEGIDDDGELPETGELPESVQRYIDNLNRKVSEIDTWRQEQESTAAQQQEDAQLDRVLDAMHNRYGQFDDRWIYMGLAEGMSPQQAFESWQNHVQEIISSHSKPAAPKLLGGQGGVPSDRVELPKTPRDRRNLVADLLQNAQQ